MPETCLPAFKCCIALLATAILAGCTSAPKDAQREADEVGSQSQPSGSANTDGAESGSSSTAEASTNDAPGAEMPQPADVKSAKTDAGKAGTYIGKSKNLVAVPSIAMPGKLMVSRGCLVVVSGSGAPATAIFPQAAKAEYSGDTLIAIASEGKRYALGSEVIIPGGGIDKGDVQLVEPLPPACPDILYGIGG